jgi:hypothetical protein
MSSIAPALLPTVVSTAASQQQAGLHRRRCHLVT